MAKKSKKDRYGGIDLFDFIENEIETGLEILENSTEKGKDDVYKSGELSSDRRNDRQADNGDVALRSGIKSAGQKTATTLFNADIGEVVSDISGANGESAVQHSITLALLSTEDGVGHIGRLQNDGRNEKRSGSGGDTADERSGLVRITSENEKQRGLLSGRADGKSNIGAMDRGEDKDSGRDERGGGERGGDKKNEGMDRAGEKRDYKQISEILISGNKDKYAKNIAAIKLLKELENENRYPIEQEQIVLASYSGWGGLPQVFDNNNSVWRAEYEELRDLLNSKEYEAARASTQNSFYTPKLLVDTIYQALNRFGLSEGDEQKLILEPSAGAGAFIAFSEYRPENTKFECVELDGITSKLLDNLYPSQVIYKEQPFQYIDLPNKYDAVVGNPPFGDVKIFDAENEIKKSSNDYKSNWRPKSQTIKIER